MVDDIADNRNILARRFQKRNFEIVEADCGMTALELIAAGSFDTILLDVMMPDMSGLEVLRRIRSGYSPEALPVIMVTANNQSADVVEGPEDTCASRSVGTHPDGSEDESHGRPRRPRLYSLVPHDACAQVNFEPRKAPADRRAR